MNEYSKSTPQVLVMLAAAALGLLLCLSPSRGSDLLLNHVGGPFSFAAPQSTAFPNTSSLSMAFSSPATNKWLQMSDANFGVFNSNTFTFSFWVKRNALTNAVACLFGQWGFGGSRAFNILFNDNDTLAYTVTTNGTTSSAGFVTTATFGTGVWYHFVVQHDSVTHVLRLWTNNLSEVTNFTTKTTPTNAIFNSAGPVTIGFLPSLAASINGNMDEVAFVSGRLADPSEFESSGKPINLTGMSGLKSWVRSDNGVTFDEVLASAWGNTNSVAQSPDVP